MQDEADESSGDEKELKVLNRIIRYTDQGIELEADLRHAELIVKQLGLEEAEPLTNPAAEEPIVDPASIPSLLEIPKSPNFKLISLNKK